MAVYRNAESRNLTSIRELSHNSNHPDPRVVCCKDIDAAPEHPDPLERIQTVRYWLDNNTEETLRLLSSRRHDTTQASRCRCYNACKNTCYKCEIRVGPAPLLCAGIRIQIGDAGLFQISHL
jgi:hypothetical protein